MSLKYYTGVGSRKTPPDVLGLMVAIAQKMAVRGVVLRSGGADGADKAFEQGCSVVRGLADIFFASHCTKASMDIAAQFHPAWGRCSQFARKLHGRNSFQVLGMGLETPSKVLLCWTPDGCVSHASRAASTGGTGTAISIAEYYKVPIYNLKISNHRKIWEDWAGKI